MHELAITRDIIAYIAERAREEKLTNVSRVAIRLGALTSYKREPIAYYFGLLQQEHAALRASALEIEEVAGAITCRRCGATSALEDPLLLSCPRCDATDVLLIAGQELVVKEIAGD